jgi:hypothetical protein
MYLKLWEKQEQIETKIIKQKTIVKIMAEINKMVT